MLQKIRGNAKGFTLIELMIIIVIIGILAAIAIPNFISYRNKTFCTMAESDANNIGASISDYFAIPTHTAISDATYDAYAGSFKPAMNTYTVLASSPNSAITITVTDASGRCPTEYKNAIPVNSDGNGWNGLIYQKVVKL